MPMRLVAVGAIACDVILGVPFYPPEDSKLRATAFHKRRGGNVGNTLEVLQQLLQSAGTVTGEAVGMNHGAAEIELNLVAALPSRTSPSIEFLTSSFGGNATKAAKNGMHVEDAVGQAGPVVNMQHCLYREGYEEPVTSYIISSDTSHSRTIVNHNPLPEMTLNEFDAISNDLLCPTQHGTPASDDEFWFHFEGRIPETTLECMSRLRNHAAFTSSTGGAATPLTISVELETPGRHGLQALAYEADVVFYSRSWAEGEGYESAEACLHHQSRVLRQPRAHFCTRAPEERLLVCTWGSSGACGLLASSSLDEGVTTNAVGVIRSPAHEFDRALVVDATGAGDTFIAGMLFQLLTQRPLASGDSAAVNQSKRLQEALDFANALAGQKLMRHGFGGLSNVLSR